MFKYMYFFRQNVFHSINLILFFILLVFSSIGNLALAEAHSQIKNISFAGPCVSLTLIKHSLKNLIAKKGFENKKLKQNHLHRDW
jgi:hypothetical protein